MYFGPRILRKAKCAAARRARLACFRFPRVALHPLKADAAFRVRLCIRSRSRQRRLRIGGCSWG